MSVIDRFRDLCADDRGQALYEAAAFAPLVIFGIGAMIYFTQLGILAERSETAVRYGNDVSYKNNNSAYSIATIYQLLDQVQNPTTNSLGPLCLESSTAAPATAVPTGVSATATAAGASVGTGASVSATGLPAGSGSNDPGASQTRIQKDIRDAIVQAQNDGGDVGPSAKPFFKPTDITVPPCQGGTLDLNSAPSTGGYNSESSAEQANGGLPVSTAGFSIKASIAQPQFLNIGGAFATNDQTSAHMTFINVAAPSALLTCLPGVGIAASVFRPSLTPAQQQQLASFCPGPPTATTNAGAST